MIDLYGRKINYLRISVTDLCNLRCVYCMPVKGIHKDSHYSILKLEEITEIAKVLIDLGVDKIRITGGEPLVRKGILKLIADINNISGLKDFAITTNGILLKKFAKPLKDAGIKRINISIDTLDKDKYKYITRGGNIKDVLEGIECSQTLGLNPVKLNVVLINNFNVSEIEKFVNLTQNNNVDVRFIELMPIGESSSWAYEHYISSQIVLEKVKNLIKIDKSDKSSPAQSYKLPNAKGLIGLINPVSGSFCQYCNRIRLTSDGKLKMCLHSDNEINLKDSLRQGMDVKKIIKNGIALKPEKHNLGSGKYIESNMYQIGG